MAAHRFLKSVAPPTLPAKASLEQFLGAVKDQGELGSCTGNAYAGIREFLNNKYAKGGLSFAPLFVYYMERLMEGTIMEDAGADPRDGCRVLNKYGVCLEGQDPYNVGNFSVAPTHDEIAEALAYKAGAYHRITSQTIEVKAAIASGYAVSVGFTVYDSFEGDAFAKDGEMPMPKLATETVLGGHEVYAFAYDDTHTNKNGTVGAAKIRNSWGPSWGQAGSFWMPYPFLDSRDDVSDLWLIHLGKGWVPAK